MNIQARTSRQISNLAATAHVQRQRELSGYTFTCSGTDEELGFTLVEVLVALVLSTVLLLIIFDGTAGARQSLSKANARADALRLADTLLTRARGGDLPESNGDEGALRWTLRREPLLRDPRGQFRLDRIEVRVSDRSGTLLSSLSARTLVAGADGR